MTLREEERRSPLAAQLDEATLYERRTALRALLRRPLLTAEDPRSATELTLVRRHAGELREWLARHPGWTLQVDSELARLRKLPADTTDATRPARDPKSKVPFTRRRYVLLCLALAALGNAERQTTLGTLADQVVGYVAADPGLARAGVSFDLKSHDQRRDLVQVVRLLLDYQVLRRVDGDEELYLKERGDVLYNVHRPALAALLNVRRGPSTVAAEGFEQRLEAIVEEPLPESDDARRRRLREHLTRRLLDDPVLEYATLDEEALAYLRGQRAFLLARIEQWTGLVGEVRAEGIALVDERDELSDLKMPEQGTSGHLALLLAERLAEEARRGATVGRAALEACVAELIARHRSVWRKDVGEAGAERRLAEETVERFEALGLVRRTEDGVEPRPVIARYGVREAETVDGSQESLFASAEEDA